MVSIVAMARPEQEGATPRSRAKAAHLDFLRLGKDADFDIPVLKEVQKEYSTLP
jgi:hypothetical protein